MQILFVLIHIFYCCIAIVLCLYAAKLITVFVVFVSRELCLMKPLNK